MSIQDSNFIDFDGGSVPGRVPARTHNAQEPLTKEQAGHAQAAFARFKTDARLSIAPTLQRRTTLPDGVVLQMTTGYGLDRVEVLSVPAPASEMKANYYVYDTFKRGATSLDGYRGEIGAVWTPYEDTTGITTGGYLTLQRTSGIFKEITASGIIKSEEAYMEAVVENISPISSFVFIMINPDFRKVTYSETAASDGANHLAELYVSYVGGYSSHTMYDGVGASGPALPTTFGVKRKIRVESRLTNCKLLIDNILVAEIDHPTGALNLMDARFLISSNGYSGAVSARIHDIKVWKLPTLPTP